MIRPADLWEALDTLALERGLTPSGLARAAGLDPTTFNPSRRFSPQGDMRWMALPTLLRVLDVLKIPPAQFISGLEGQGRGLGRPVGGRVRGVPLSRLQISGLFDSAGHPTGVMWEDVTLPCAITGDAYAVRVDTDAMEPFLRLGSSLVMMPDIPPRRSDRVVLIRRDKEPVIGILVETSLQEEDLSLEVDTSRASQSDDGGRPLSAAGALRWAVLPYTAAGKGSADVRVDAGTGAVVVEGGKVGMLLHRIGMATF
ncbi:helix-turn-helix transcriptional regulator [Acetobacter orleanensis]|uniref:Transcriptional regulator n=1 Tax=Acetobacter orleanensis TaxID=104099 RepID=A0A4Y3TLM3_9PROT|nr:helix-turn-helix transcriptional regulator [Acetobacter orleanensis]PCD79606.1 DNA-binding protein [Acetobacter orleanensis]GAN68697.1 transcriptional regulator [Acetobacter orleanensis JCM 7639]GBR24639.1 transcriptional regulator [Acetobacter orleanensis NRIC 0473]GEB82329.1 transcriptional regulator [Acetobacter orleanensis]